MDVRGDQDVQPAGDVGRPDDDLLWKSSFSMSSAHAGDPVDGHVLGRRGGGPSGALAAPLPYDSMALATVRPGASMIVIWIPEPPPRFQTALPKWVSRMPLVYSVPSVVAEHSRPGHEAGRGNSGQARRQERLELRVGAGHDLAVGPVAGRGGVERSWRVRIGLAGAEQGAGQRGWPRSEGAAGHGADGQRRHGSEDTSSPAGYADEPAGACRAAEALSSAR